MVILRVGGRNFDVDAFLRESGIAPASVFRRGEPQFPESQPNGRVLAYSGMNIDVSTAEFGKIEQQTRETLQFLADHPAEIERLRTYPGVEGLELDFAVNGNDGVLIENYRFVPELLEQIGRLGITLCISRYDPMENDDEESV